MSFLILLLRKIDQFCGDILSDIYLNLLSDIHICMYVYLTLH